MQTGINPAHGIPAGSQPSSADLTLQQSLQVIQTLAHHSADTRDGVAKGVDAIANYFGSPFASIKVNIDDSPIEYSFHRANTPGETWRQLCSVPMLECLSTQSNQVSFFVERTTGTRTAVFVLPTNATNPSAVGAACLVVRADNAAVAKRFLAEFETLLAALMKALVESSERTVPETIAAPIESVPASQFVQSTDFLTQFCNGKIWDHPSEFAFHLVNGLCNQLKCLDVSLGVVRKNQVQLLAISGYDSVSQRSPGCLAIEQAMSEALDAGHEILLQRETESGSVNDQLNCALHQALRAKSGNGSCFSLPLSHNGQIVAICTLRRDETRPFTKEEVAMLESHQERLAEFTAISCRLRQSFASHFHERIQAWMKAKYFSGRGRKAFAMAILAAIGLYLFIPWPHSISIPCTLVSAELRTYSAPYSGKLCKVHFRSGDWVKQGAVLFEMDTEELLNQRMKLEAELRSRSQAMIRFLQADDTPKAGEEKSSINAIRNELSIIESKLDRSIVLAQESGTIIDSSLHQRVGETIAIGERMFDFAPSRTQRVELKIPDYLGMEFQAGQNGRFATSAEPGVWRDIVLERVEMASTSQNGENYIKAIGASTQFDEDARFGFSGFARISVGNQPGWWILLQQPIRYVQRKVSEL